VRAALLVILAGCVASDPGDAAGRADRPGPCDASGCGDPAAPSILFPGNPACAGGGCERDLAGDDLFIPARGGSPWGDTYALGVADAVVLAGFSSGRIALLRRLALVGDGDAAVLLDPSVEDGARDFLGTGPVRGSDLVATWLRADPTRRFLLVRDRLSVGWADYAALDATDVGPRVAVCAVDVGHRQVPTIAGLHAALVDPEAWDDLACLSP
jgi:hypothetical protein